MVNIILCIKAGSLVNCSLS